MTGRSRHRVYAACCLAVVLANYVFLRQLFNFSLTPEFASMIPIPDALLQAVVAMLTEGSAEAVTVLFSFTGTPFSREGQLFILPGISIEIASQCSGIRSSLALLLSCLLAGHLMLRTTSRKFLLILFVMPMAMVKNAVRIVTLSMLAIHVDKSWLTGSDLHRRGGIVFFVLTLLMMAPILWGLRRTETR